MSQTWSIPFPTTPQTVAWLAHFARTGSKDMRVRRAAEQIVWGIPGKDYLSEMLAITRWVEHNVAYRKDVQDIETVQHPAVVLESRAGDCDDMSSLIASLLLSIGHRVAFVTVGFGKGDYSHVFCQALDQRSGTWIVLDPVAAPDVRGMLRRVRKYRIYPV